MALLHRDLHLGNIAVEFPFLRTVGVNALMKASRHPICHSCVMRAAIPHLPSLPAYFVESADICGRLSCLMQEEASSIVVKLLDFGCAFRPGTNGVLLEDQGDPALVLKAPECIISKLITNVLAPVLISDNTGTALTPPAESQRAMPTVDPLGKAPLVSSGAGLPRIFASRYLGPLPPKFRMLLEEAALDKIQRTTMGEDMDRLIGVHRIESDQASDALNIDISQLPTAAVEANWARLEQQTLAA
ncbi:hypothetical protein B0H17DRAFT_1210454 [Mycena rosella]|uniref:Uncharacterized protein n=1 Tax=Mycena rosella TaxID=1033263 RepID=A0AAD7G8S6_MYCRO|nr:hypothetical protein B0H17DRAFT_1210454 [Mycena rosella]